LSRILAIDYGLKRCGLAVSDPLQLIATPLVTISTGQLIAFLDDYVKREKVETLVVGMPLKGDGSDTDSTAAVRRFIAHIKERFPYVPVFEEDERFTSKMAMQAMIDGGLKKKDRRDKTMIDKTSAAIILQSFMQRRPDAG
jgi:putative Holliday junction resolvase